MADDDEDDRALMALALKETKISHRLQCLNDGQEVLDNLEKCTGENSGNFPNIIFLDLNMPKKNGREVLIEIKLNPFFKSVKVFIFSTYISDFDLTTIKNAGASGCITKPADFSSLINILTGLCTEAQNGSSREFIKV